MCIKRWCKHDLYHSRVKFSTSLCLQFKEVESQDIVNAKFLHFMGQINDNFVIQKHNHHARLMLFAIICQLYVSLLPGYVYVSLLPGYIIFSCTSQILHQQQTISIE